MSLPEAREHLRALVEEAAATGQAVTVNVDSRPAVVIIAADEYEAMWTHMQQLAFPLSID